MVAAHAGGHRHRAAGSRRSLRSARQIGAGGATATLNDGRMFIALKPHEPAQRQRRPGDQPPAAATRQDPGHHALYAGGAGHHHRRTAVARPSISTRWPTPMRASSITGPPIFLDKLKSTARHHRRRQRPGRMPARCSTSRSTATPRRATASCRRPSTTRSPMLSASASSRRCSPQLNQYHVILEVQPQFQTGPDALNDIYVTSSSGQQVPLSTLVRLSARSRPSWSTIRASFPSVTISFNLKPGRRDRRRRQRHPPARAATRQAGLAGHELPGQRPGVPVVAVERADPDRGGAGRDLHHPRRAL